MRGFPGSSAGKESTCNAGDPNSIPELGRSPGEGIDYPLQCSWASLVAQMLKLLPAIQETWIWSLGWEDLLEEGMATDSSILAWRIPMDKGAWPAMVHGVACKTELLSTTQHVYIWIYMCVRACVLSHFSHVQLFATLWTVAHQAPLSMEFSRQENTGVGCHFLL